MARNKQVGTEVKLCQIDTMVYLGTKNIITKISMFSHFLKMGGVAIADSLKLNRARALERFDRNFKVSDIEELTIDGQANETWLRKNGLLCSVNGKYELSPLAEAIKSEKISPSDYCFLLLSKQWIKIKKLGGSDEYKDNLLAIVFEDLLSCKSIPVDDYVTHVGNIVLSKYQSQYSDLALSNQEAGRYLIEPLLLSGIIKVSGDSYVLPQNMKELAEDYIKNAKSIRKIGSLDCVDEEYWNGFQYGFFDLIDEKNESLYSAHYPHLFAMKEFYKNIVNLPLQQIVYGAPGTGKSFGMDEDVKLYNMKDIRTTFHPDSDYSTFVGAYKPQMERMYSKQVILDYDSLVDKFKEYIAQKGNMTVASTMIGSDYHDSIVEMQPQHSIADLVADAYKSNTTYDSVVRGGMAVYENSPQQKPEKKIVYKYTQQAFLKAYVAAWKDLENPHVLVIEEINRGNCAQIFGDLFQLLDRNDIGFSKYPITADTDIMQELNEEFEGLSIANSEAINAHYKDDVIADVLNGSRLLLPNNLYIWATMNTSDQSLFPIDSAFKRRWEWKYVPISDAGKKWKICVNGTEYDWWSFIEQINNKIWDATHSEDKKLGYFFCKADRKTNESEKENNVISADRFVGKVLFYIYNDVFKDYGFDDAIFKDKEDGNKELLFQCYFKSNGKPDEKKIEVFLKNLDVKLAAEIEADANPVEEIESDDTQEAEVREEGNVTVSSFKVVLDGETIEEAEQFDTYLTALRKMGMDKVEEIASEKEYNRYDCPFVSREQFDAIKERENFSYIEADGFQVIKGINKRGMSNFLKLCAEKLGHNITIE